MTNQTSTSTTQSGLVNMSNTGGSSTKDEDYMDYHFWEHREVKHPTTDFQTGIHLVKGCLGAGIFAMPRAFAHTGLVCGLILTAIAGFFCSYGVHQLVKCAQILCRKHHQPSLQYAYVSLYAFKSGPSATQKFADIACLFTKFSLGICWTGVCCVYIVFVSTNLKVVTARYTKYDLDIRIYSAALWPLLILLVTVRHLKYMAVFSMMANILNAVAVLITFYYFFRDFPSPVHKSMVPESVMDLPEFFSIAIFALEGVGVILPLENSMKNPTHFISCPGVLNVSMTFVVSMYALVGFFGYFNYGSVAKKYGSITHNLPEDEHLAQSVNLILTVAMFLTYALQFYVPMEIFWTLAKDKFNENYKSYAELGLRVLIVTITVIVAVVLPDLGVFISLLGAVCLSTLGLIFPGILDIITGWESPGHGKYYWILIKNIIVLMFGFMAFFTGTGISIRDMIKFYKNEK